jgi:hypothetical protein
MSRSVRLDLNTRGHDWRTHLRQSAVFVALVTPAWYRDALAQRQLLEARALGKPLVFLVQGSTPLPPLQEHDTVYPWETLAELTTLMRHVVDQYGTAVP